MSQVDQIKVYSYPDGRMDAKNAAQYCGLSEKTLAMKRSDGTGPAYIKRGKVFYFQKDIDEWLLADGKRTTTGGPKLRE